MTCLPLRLPGYCEFSDALKRELMPMPATCNRGCYSLCYSKIRCFTLRFTRRFRAPELREKPQSTQAGTGHKYAIWCACRSSSRLRFAPSVRTCQCKPCCRLPAQLPRRVTRTAGCQKSGFHSQQDLQTSTSEFSEPDQSPATPSSLNVRLC